MHRMKFIPMSISLAIMLAFLAPAIAEEDLAAQNTKDRVTVSGKDYPWRAIGRIQWAGIANRAHCTGALIGRKLVLTAAHCVYDLHHGLWLKASQVHFLPGFDKGEYAAHSIGEKMLISPNFSVEKWNDTDNLPYDWALIYLEKPLGDTVGYLGWQPFDKSYPKAVVDKHDLLLAGYPRDRQYVLSLESDCKVDAFGPSGNLFTHNCKLAHGDSGGPFAISKNGYLSVIGLNNAVIGETGNTKSTAIALGPIASFIRHFLKEDGTLDANLSNSSFYGWSPTTNIPLPSGN